MKAFPWKPSMLLTILIWMVSLLPQISLALEDGPGILKSYGDSVVLIEGRATLKTGGETKWQGSGFIVHPRGFVITNSHVIPDLTQFEKFTLTATPGKKSSPSYKLSMVKREPELDIALLLLEERSEVYKTVKLGDSNGVIGGHRIFVLGYPLGLDLSVTPGDVNNTSGEHGWIQTSSPVNPGNSGGPVFDENGLVVGLIA